MNNEPRLRSSNGKCNWKSCPWKFQVPISCRIGEIAVISGEAGVITLGMLLLLRSSGLGVNYRVSRHGCCLQIIHRDRLGVLGGKRKNSLQLCSKSWIVIKPSRMRVRTMVRRWCCWTNEYHLPATRSRGCAKRVARYSGLALFSCLPSHTTAFPMSKRFVHWRQMYGHRWPWRRIQPRNSLCHGRL